MGPISMKTCSAVTLDLKHHFNTYYKYMRTLLCLLGLLCIFGGHPSQAQAQALQEGEERHGYRYARPGYATMTVYIWGNVGKAGIWEIESGTDLVELLSAARVPGLGTEQADMQQRIILRIYRMQGTERQEIYDENLESVLEAGTRGPTLQAGDVLSVETQTERKFSFRTVAQYVGTASSLLILFLRLRRL